MRKDLDYMKKKLESIEVDRHWLEQQLKAAKKQNKLLRAELDIRLAGPEEDEDTKGRVVKLLYPHTIGSV